MATREFSRGNRRNTTYIHNIGWVACSAPCARRPFTRIIHECLNVLPLVPLLLECCHLNRQRKNVSSVPTNSTSGLPGAFLCYTGENMYL